jgi:hypothetical protein
MTYLIQLINEHISSQQTSQQIIFTLTKLITARFVRSHAFVFVITITEAFCTHYVCIS